VLRTTAQAVIDLGEGAGAWGLRHQGIGIGHRDVLGEYQHLTGAAGAQGRADQPDVAGHDVAVTLPARQGHIDTGVGRR